MANLVTGILAHVDAGKTTLAEGILYVSGEIRRLGRVDHQDAFLDTYELERTRGITIFSKQAQLHYTDQRGAEHSMTLLDTPGHVDFSAEMERTLQVLDYAILVINGADGVQGHVQTLWKLLKRYEVPVFLFINKMDQEGTDREALLQEVRSRLDERCVDFTYAEGPDADGIAVDEAQNAVFYENAAMCSEVLLEAFLESGRLETEQLIRAIVHRELFPCYFGSALKLEGVQDFLDSFFLYTREPEYGPEFGAKVFKIGRDKQGKRLTYLKVTGGSLKARMSVCGRAVGRNTAETGETEQYFEEKVDQIRLYSGAQYQTIPEAEAGSICAVTGLTKTCCGQGLGCERDSELPILEPVLTYQVILPPECDVHRMFLQLSELTEEEPQLHLVWNEKLNEIHAQVMGEVQMEVLKSMVWERYHVEIEFGCGSIVYKETIRTSAEGVGHFEPLRHYAEVHLLLEPGEAGSGLQFDTNCSTDMLNKNWQRLILTHLEERQHPGVLTGSDITDMRITLIAGKAHLKHTEGGDFRQATYRAVRQGLKMAESVLLEPVYEVCLEVPSQMIGRALTDLQRMHGRFDAPQTEGEMSILNGFVPVSELQGYPMELAAYSGGRGRISCTLSGYEPCHNAEEVIEASGYDAEADLENPTGSVFCAHGAGYVVSWNQVYDYMHVESGLARDAAEAAEEGTERCREDGKRGNVISSKKGSSESFSASIVDDKELQEIFERTYRSGGEERGRYRRTRKEEPSERFGTYRVDKKKSDEEYLLVDGYNIIFSWEELRELSKVNIESARTKLMDILCNYQGYKKCTLILVFDAYRVEGNPGGVMQYHNIHVVYTKEAETADQYIEKTVHKIGRKYRVRVATSDALEQIIIWGQGAERLSAQGLLEEVEQVQEEIRKEHLNQPEHDRTYLFDHLPEELTEVMEDVRLGKRKFQD
ncbi:MAG: TetM/TetW/TetO/TetS family tetracycline resistance ribosomal protection protein [Lachnospiraceae bacterium]|nr:TetM/TetW/TetO/TetS family tetracycline resistance ribosomal protection protein [Lachnospiraceae bacterium]